MEDLCFPPAVPLSILSAVAAQLTWVLVNKPEQLAHDFFGAPQHEKHEGKLAIALSGEENPRKSSS